MEVGVPLIVNVFPTTLVVNPDGRLLTVTPDAPPPQVKVIGVIGFPEQTVWPVLPPDIKVAIGLTVIVPPKLIAPQADACPVVETV